MSASVDEIAKACYNTFVTTISQTSGKNRAGENYPAYEKLPHTLRISIREFVRKVSIDLNKSGT